jgi:hypothetical protein
MSNAQEPDFQDRPQSVEVRLQQIAGAGLEFSGRQEDVIDATLASKQ